MKEEKELHNNVSNNEWTKQVNHLCFNLFQFPSIIKYSNNIDRYYC
jgi:hypothetical protein